MLKVTRERAPAIVAAAMLAMGGLLALPAQLASATEAPYPVRSVPNTLPTMMTPTAECLRAVKDPDGVLFIGDSITAQGFADITARFTAAGHPVCINAQPGRLTFEGVDLLRSYFHSGFGALTVVMALGTNDWHSAPGHVADMVRQTEAIVGPNRNLWWVNTYLACDTNPSFSQADFLAGSRRVNAEIASAKSANMRIVDWFDQAAIRPVLFTADALHPTPDHIHPSLAGNATRTVLILDGIARVRPWWQRD